MRLIEVDVLKAWIENWFTKNRHYHPYAKNNNIPITELYDILEQMPSAQSEIIRCKDCEKYGTKFCAMDIWTDQVTIRRAKPNDFCSKVERRIDEAD